MVASLGWTRPRTAPAWCPASRFPTPTRCRSWPTRPWTSWWPCRPSPAARCPPTPRPRLRTCLPWWESSPTPRSASKPLASTAWRSTPATATCWTPSSRRPGINGPTGTAAPRRTGLAYWSRSWRLSERVVVPASPSWSASTVGMTPSRAGSRPTSRPGTPLWPPPPVPTPSTSPPTRRSLAARDLPKGHCRGVRASTRSWPGR